MQQQWDASSPAPEPEPEDEQPCEPEDLDHDREAGRRIHLMYAGKECPEASSAERERAEKARRVDESQYTFWVSEWDLEPLGTVQEMRETRWWLFRDGKEIYSGQTDVVWIRGEIGGPADILVGDLKGLWGHHDAAPINMQLRRYVALIAANMESLGYTELRSAVTYLNQPAITMNPKPARFTADDIAQAVLEMWADVEAMSDPNAKRVAGSVQCKRCRAKLVCPEYQQVQTRISNALIPSVTAVTEEPPKTKVLEASVKLLAGEQLSKLLAWADALEDAVKLAKAEAKKRLRWNEDSVPGWRLRPNPNRSKVDDVTKVFTRFNQEYGVSADEFTKLCSITKKNCEQLLRDKTKLKGSELEELLGTVLEGATAAIHVVSSLEKVKP